MAIKEGDRVVLKNQNDARGVIERIYPAVNDSVAIVNFPDGKRKVLLDDLTVVTDAVTLTPEKFRELTEKVLDRESLEISEDSYAILRASSELIFKRLESLLFGGDNG